MVEFTTDWFLHRFGGRVVEIHDRGTLLIVRGKIFNIQVIAGMLEIELHEPQCRNGHGWVPHTQMDFTFALQGFHPRFVDEEGGLILSSGVTGGRLQFFP